MSFYNDGSRELQDRFDTRRLADRLEDRIVHSTLSDDERAFIESLDCFFLATADADGQPDVSYNGGMPGFVRVLDDQTLAFPDYDGNGMFKSLGNILVNPKVGLLFIDFENPDRMRVNGSATVSADDPLLAEFPGAVQVVRVRAERIFPNCPRYIHRMQVVEQSEYVPCAAHAAPTPKWKTFAHFNEVLPPDDPARTRGDAE